MYRIFIPSRGRAFKCYTARVLKAEAIDYKIVIEPRDRDEYLKTNSEDDLIILPQSNRGITYVRNYIKDLAALIAPEDHYHWQIDDNIKQFYFRKNYVMYKSNFKQLAERAEAFIQKLSNIGIASFVHQNFQKSRKGPFKVNRVCYSCMLIRNDPIRFSDTVIEDIDYTIQVLKAGDVSLCFNDIIMAKYGTQRLSGGNTDTEHTRKEERIRATIEKYPEFKFRLVEKQGLIALSNSRYWSTFPQRPRLKTQEA